ncbi:MAG: hypothetical protein CVU41_03370 [Chloroflexi bacterium HGW-Chloroflexi-3]|nr:MAG: hypothetical protein CVU41_03370 [Chloroflexi bacterium HGW-Chloroflexi-3]
MSEKTNGTTKTLSQIFGWNRTSYVLMSSFALLLFIIGYVWWPLVEEYISTYNPDLPFWIQFDWLLLSIFLVMSLLLMAKADIKKDLPIIFVGLVGGLVIESWGTQTDLWFYYTYERPPLWIIPAWPIASLSIDRLFQLLNVKSDQIPSKIFQISYWVIFTGFYIYMLYFVWPTLDKSLTIMALFLCAFLILTPVNQRAMLLTFIAGSGLGYFLELWGTTRYCWTYYTFQTPPFFAVMAHGMAAVAFWRVVQLFRIFEPKSNKLLQKMLKTNKNKKKHSLKKLCLKKGG